MSDDLTFEPPAITDEDIRWASQLLQLPDDAFHGKTGTDPRQDVLKSMERIDVAACPGSGKTTLLVAKLAILAEKWQHRTRGICVLSHTNAARHEIEGRLGSTAAGQRLLAYPHDAPKVHIRVGSIHSVKGETHTATLVLETFWYDHNLEKLLPWLNGSKCGSKSAGKQQTTRLKLHYVAMTRPTHLLCLAMKRRTLENEEGELDDSLIGDLESHGWRVKVI